MQTRRTRNKRVTRQPMQLNLRSKAIPIADINVRFSIFLYFILFYFNTKPKYAHIIEHKISIQSESR